MGLKSLKLDFNNPHGCAVALAGSADICTFAEMDAAFIENLELPLGRRADNWALVKEIAEGYVRLVDEPARKCLGVLMEINAMRRIIEPVASAELDQLFAVAEVLRVEVSDEAANDRLNGLLIYHGGIWFSRIGEYHHAADYQHRTALIEERRGKSNLAAISRLREMWEHLNEALVTTLGIQVAVEEVVKAARVVVEICTGDDSTDRMWRLYNAPAHVLLAMIWASSIQQIEPDMVTEWVTLLEEYKRMDPAGAEANWATLTAIKAGVAFIRHDYEGAGLHGTAVMHTQIKTADEQGLMTAHLVAVYVLDRIIQQDDEPDVRVTLDALKPMLEPGHGMHQIRAIAQRAHDHLSKSL